MRPFTRRCASGSGRQLDELLEDPSAHSHRASYFAPLDGQALRFKIVVDGVRFYFTIVLKFLDSKDESTLLVSDILLREL